jgi:hypothetical protein
MPGCHEFDHAPRVTVTFSGHLRPAESHGWCRAHHHNVLGALLCVILGITACATHITHHTASDLSSGRAWHNAHHNQ